jgi:glucose-6-phosphate isomerase, archaeal
MDLPHTVRCTKRAPRQSQWIVYMSTLLPSSVMIDAACGEVSPFTGRYQKRLSELEGIFHDRAAWTNAIRELADPIIYEVIEVRQDGNDLFFGTTTVAPGQVGPEFYMTRGHFHARRDRGEVYATMSGQGILLLETRDGQTEVLEMRAGAVAAIPPDWAHRTINTGDCPLIFSWVCSVDAGHDYASIRERGMRRLVIARDGGVAVIDNPRIG